MASLTCGLLQSDKYIAHRILPKLWKFLATICFIILFLISITYFISGFQHPIHFVMGFVVLAAAFLEIFAIRVVFEFIMSVLDIRAHVRKLTGESQGDEENLNILIDDNQNI